mgnify:CR=1 FL=1
MSQYIPNYEPCIYAYKEGHSPQWYGASEQLYVPAALPRPFQQLPIFKKLSTSVGDDTSQRISLGMHYPSPANESTSAVAIALATSS